MKKILIIDDENDIREGVKTALELNNYKVFTAESGKYGFGIACEIIPDLILCDIMMPDGDGYWVLENVRKQKELLAVPFVFLTAKGEREDFRNGMNLGADDYLTKPFNIAELLKTVESRLSKNAAYKSLITEGYVKSAKIDKDKFVLLDTGKSIEPIQINTIECILADNIYSQIHLTNKKLITIRKSLAEWETILPEAIFVRVHRSTIINLNYVKSIEKWFNQTMVIHMLNFDKSITISRSYVSKLKGKVFI